MKSPARFSTNIAREKCYPRRGNAFWSLLWIDRFHPLIPYPVDVKSTTGATKIWYSELLPAAYRALDWIDRYGDLDRMVLSNMRAVSQGAGQPELEGFLGCEHAP